MPDHLLWTVLENEVAEVRMSIQATQVGLAKLHQEPVRCCPIAGKADSLNKRSFGGLQESRGDPPGSVISSQKGRCTNQKFKASPAAKLNRRRLLHARGAGRAYQFEIVGMRSEFEGSTQRTG